MVHVGTYKLEGNMRVVGDSGLANEVVLSLEVDGGVENLSAVKVVETWHEHVSCWFHPQRTSQVDRLLTGHDKGLLEVDVELLGDALGLDLGLALNGNLEFLALEKLDVEVLPVLHHVANGVGLLDNDSLVLLGSGSREVELGEGLLRPILSNEHDALEGVNVGLDTARRLNVANDLHGVLVGLGISHDNAFDGQLGVIELVLSNLRNADEDAIKGSVFLS